MLRGLVLPLLFGVLLFCAAGPSAHAQYSGAQTLTAPTLEQDGEYGRDVASVGDVNGDGTPDMVVGAYGSCRAYLVSGADGSVVHTLEPEFCFGNAVDGLGDVNGDGTPDVIVGAYKSNEVYLMSGSDGSEIRRLEWPGSSSGLIGGRFGKDVAGVGDVNGDGTPDVIVGANNEEVDGSSAAGRAYVMSGADGSVIHTLESPNAQRNGYFGDAVAGVGDLTGDGTPDVAVGATNEHSAYLFSGADGSVIETIGADTYSGFLGEALAGISDVNGDSTPDLLIGASGEDAYGVDQAGRVYLISGADGSTIRTFASPNATRRGDFGHAVAALDDANGDGVSDVLIGARRESVNGTLLAGRVYAFSAANGSVLGTLSSPNVEEGGEFGYAVAGLGDLGNGGAPEVLVGARTETVNGTSAAGRAYTFSSDKPLLGTSPPPSIAVPSSLTGTVVAGPAAELSWDAVSSSDLDEYRIYRSKDPITGSPSGRSPHGTVGGSTTSYTDQNAEAGAVYYYRVTAATGTGEESDFSNEVSLFLYPQSVSATVSRSFGGAADSTGYRLVALPGQVDHPLADAVSGEAGVEWQAFYDDGSDSNFLQRYNGSDSFTFRPGTGFWLTATSEWTFSESISTVALRGDSATAIPLREGWNVISNPLGTDVSWASVEAATSGSLQPLWAFAGSFTSADTMASAATGTAYYFYNDATGRDSLIIPYPGAPRTGKSEKSAPSKDVPRLALTALSADAEAPSTSTVRIGLSGEGKVEPKSVVAPPGRFERVSLRITAEPSVQSSKRRRILMSARREIEGAGRTFYMRLTSRSEGAVRLSAQNVESLRGREVRLLVPSDGTSHNLYTDEEVTINPSSEEAHLQLAVGTKRYVEDRAEAVRPDKVSLTAYPNPVRRQGMLVYTLPKAGEVTLRVYDVLGREVATVVDARREAGRHTARLATDQLSSGVYFGRLQAGEQRLTQKITVVR